MFGWQFPAAILTNHHYINEICLWELSKGLNISLQRRSMVLCISYQSATKLSRVTIGFSSVWNYGTSVALTSDRSNTFWQSLRVRASTCSIKISVNQTLSCCHKYTYNNKTFERSHHWSILYWCMPLTGKMKPRLLENIKWQTHEVCGLLGMRTGIAFTLWMVHNVDTS